MVDVILTVLFGLVIVSGVALLYFSRLMPVFPILGIIMLSRVIFDGVYKVTVFGTNVTALLGVAILALTAGVCLTGYRGLVWFVSILSLLYWSNLQAQETFGIGIRDEYIRFASVMGVFVIARNLRFKPSTSQVFVLVQLLGLVSAMISIFQFLTGTGMVVQGAVRVAGTMAHPNSAALLYAICFTVSVIAVFSMTRRPLNCAISIVFAIALVITGSIGGLLACLIMLATYGLLSENLSGRVRVVTILLMVGTLTTFVASPLGTARIAEFGGLTLTGQGAESNSLEWRIGRWSEIMQFWLDSPIIGQGFGASTSGAMLNGYPPHNEYVRILVELGLIGFCAVLVFLSVLWRRIRLAMREEGHSSDEAGLAMAVFAGMLANAASENTFSYSVPTYILAMLTGLVWDRASKSRLRNVLNLRTGPLSSKGDVNLSRYGTAP